jgi:hypothetical protein
VLVLESEHPAGALAFTPDGTRLIAAVVGARPPEIWTLANGERLKLPAMLGGPSLSIHAPPLAVHPSGRFAFLAHGPLSTFSLTDGASYHVADAGVTDGVIASLDGNWVVAAGHVNRRFRALGFRCGADGVIDRKRSWEAGQHAPNERLGPFVGTGERFVTIGARTLVIRDTATGEVRSTVPYPSHYSGSPVTSRDGRRFAVMGYGQLYLWDTAAWGKPKRVECNSSRRFVSLAFHPTRPILAGVQWGQTLVKFLDADTGKPVSKFQWKLGDLRCVAFSADGTLAAAGSASGKIVVWDVD